MKKYKGWIIYGVTLFVLCTGLFYAQRTSSMTVTGGLKFALITFGIVWLAHKTANDLYDISHINSLCLVDDDGTFKCVPDCRAVQKITPYSKEWICFDIPVLRDVLEDQSIVFFEETFSLNQWNNNYDIMYTAKGHVPYMQIQQANLRTLIGE